MWDAPGYISLGYFDGTFTWCHVVVADLKITGTLTVEFLLQSYCCCLWKALQLLNKEFPKTSPYLPACDIPIVCPIVEQKDHSTAKVKHTYCCSANREVLRLSYDLAMKNEEALAQFGSQPDTCDHGRNIWVQIRMPE